MLHPNSRHTAAEAAQAEPTEELTAEAQALEEAGKESFDGLRHRLPSLAMLATSFFASGLGDMLTQMIGEIGGHKGG